MYAQLHYRHVCFVKIETKGERYVKWKSKFRRGKFLFHPGKWFRGKILQKFFPRKLRILAGQIV